MEWVLVERREKKKNEKKITAKQLIKWSQIILSVLFILWPI